MDMDIDEQIRDILMKSTPVNDNSAPKNPPIPAAIPQNSGISVIGNQNIVIGTGVSQLLLLLSILLCCIYLR